jgi:hypothetical protein
MPQILQISRTILAFRGIRIIRAIRVKIHHFDLPSPRNQLFAISGTVCQGK